MLKDYFQTFKKYKNLIVYLAKNQISLRYRKSYLGMLWSLLNPLLTMICPARNMWDVLRGLGNRR